MSKRPNLKRQAIIARSAARRQLLQSLYQWQICDEPATITFHHLMKVTTDDIDELYFDQGWSSITNQSAELDAQLEACVHRKLALLDPIEHAILWIGAFEMTTRQDIPATVTINECVEMAKQFGADGSYKFINGTLDKLHKSLPPRPTIGFSETQLDNK